MEEVFGGMEGFSIHEEKHKYTTKEGKEEEYVISRIAFNGHPLACSFPAKLLNGNGIICLHFKPVIDDKALGCYRCYRILEKRAPTRERGCTSCNGMTCKNCIEEGQYHTLFVTGVY